MYVLFCSLYEHGTAVKFRNFLSHIAYQILIKLACVLDILSLLLCFMYHI